MVEMETRLGLRGARRVICLAKATMRFARPQNLIALALVVAIPTATIAQPACGRAACEDRFADRYWLQDLMPDLNCSARCFLRVVIAAECAAW